MCKYGRFTRGLWMATLAVLCLTASGCKKPKTVVLTKEQQKEIDAHVLNEVPSPTIPLGIQFGEAVRLLGMDAPKGAVRPGQKIEITYYWEVLQPPGPQWKIFGHLESSGKRQILDHHPVRNLYPTGQWKAGQFVIDKQAFTLDRDFSGKEARLWVGFFDEVAWSSSKKNVRLPVSSVGKGVRGKGDRVQVLTLAIRQKRGKKTASPSNSKRSTRYTVPFISEAPVIDGKLGDNSWRTAPPTAPFVHSNGKAGSGALATTAKWMYDATTLYIGFQLKDSDIQSPFTNRDDTLWKADVVEVFMRTLQDGESYVELQANPGGVQFDAQFDSHRAPQWKEAAAKYSPNWKVAVALDGTLNQSEDTDRGWSVEMAIPFTDLPGVSTTPKQGERWEANLYRIDNKGPRNASFQRTWAPVGNDFHKLEGAGLIQFGKRPPASTPTGK